MSLGVLSLHKIPYDYDGLLCMQAHTSIYMIYLMHAVEIT